MSERINCEMKLDEVNQLAMTDGIASRPRFALLFRNIDRLFVSLRTILIILIYIDIGFVKIHEFMI